jgi:hypothetical protein
VTSSIPHALRVAAMWCSSCGASFTSSLGSTIRRWIADEAMAPRIPTPMYASTAIAVLRTTWRLRVPTSTNAAPSSATRAEIRSTGTCTARSL